MTNSGGESFLDSPSPAKAFTKGAILDAGDSRPVGNSMSFTFECYQCVRPFVVVLFTHCGPTAIFWGISFTVVDAIKCFTDRLFPHINKKIFEYLPTFANGNASSSVVLERSVRWIETAFLHRRPCIMRSTILAACAMTVLSAAGGTLAMTICHISVAHMIWNAFALFATMDATEESVKISLALTSMPNKHERPELRARANNFAAWSSCHTGIITNTGNTYGQHENTLLMLNRAYTEAGGIVV